jgi:hypothetical protein
MTEHDKILTLKIDAYIKGKLPETERRAFEQQLASNAELAERVRVQRTELAILDKVLEADLRQKAQKWSAEADLTAHRTPLSMWAAAAALLLLVTSVLWFFGKNKNSDKENTPIVINRDTLQTQTRLPQDSTSKTRDFVPSEPQNKSSKPKNNPTNQPIATPSDKSQPRKTIPPSDNTTIPLTFEFEKDLLPYVEDIERTTERGIIKAQDPLSKTLQLMGNKNFATARTTISTVPNDASYYTDAQFYAATIDLLDNQPRLAAAKFQALANNESYLRRDQATFYWAVSLLRDGQKEGGKRILENIAADAEHDKQKAAIELLKKL